jgi:sugar lactone lactonase YvrE
MNIKLMKVKSTFIALLAIVMTGSLSVAAFGADSSNPATALKIVTTVAGSGEFSSVNGPALSATFRMPQGITLLGDGTILVADTQNQLIRAIKNGQVSTYAGITLDVDGRGLPIGGLIDGKLAASVFQNPADLEVDSNGNLFIADTVNHVIRKIDTQGNVTVYAGNPDGVQGAANGLAAAASFYHPSDLAIAPDGTIYVADTLNHAIRKISASGIVSTLNSSSDRFIEVTPGQVVLAGDFRDGKLNEALFNEPSALVLDAKGNLYVSDSGNQLIRYIDLAAGTVSTVAGAPITAYDQNALYVVGDYADGPAASAKFDFPKGLALTADGSLVIADSLNHAIRLLSNGKVSTVVGTLNASSGSNDGTETSARLERPTDVAVAANGDIYVADSYSNKIRKIAAYALPAGVTQDKTIQVVDGNKLISFDAKPQNVNNRIMVPVRAIVESLGYEIAISGNEKLVLTRENTTIEFAIGSKEAKQTVDGVVTVTHMDTAPYIEDGRTYVPVRFISEQLNKEVDWLSSYQAVIIR